MHMRIATAFATVGGLTCDSRSLLDCADAQYKVGLRCSHLPKVTFSVLCNTYKSSSIVTVNCLAYFPTPTK